MVRLIVLTLLGIVCFSSSYAQPNVRMYWDVADQSDTVINFGVTLEGSPTRRTFTVENRGQTTAAIYETNPNADPYYLIVNVPGVPREAPAKEEFERLDALPYFIRPGSSKSFSIGFRSIVGNPLFPPDVVAEAMLELRVVDSTAPLGPAFTKEFRLRALKTTRILATTTPWIRFDSVYINPLPLAPVRLYRAENVTSSRIRIDRQLLRMVSTVIGRTEFEVDTLPSVELGPLGSASWNVRYNPHNRGHDSAAYLLIYRPDSTAQPDTLTAWMSGIGVEQRLSLVSSVGTPSPVVIRGDTIDFGSVLVNGVGTTARIAVRNDGNIAIGIDSESKVGIARDTSAFVVGMALLSGGRVIPPGIVDTLVVSFVPVEGGEHRITYSVETDLLRRGISGVPDGEQSRRFIFRGFGQRPQIQVVPSQISYGNVVLLTSCTSSVERTFVVRNVGNAELRVDSILVKPATTRMTIEPSRFRLPPGEAQIVRCIFEPDVMGSIDGEIVLWTNSLIRSYAVQFTASVVPPDTVSVSVPLRIASRPGATVQVPVTVQGAGLTTTDRLVFSLTYQPSLLRYRALTLTGSACEGALVRSAGELPAGKLRIELEAPSNFLRRDTLLWILFDTFLGEAGSSDLTIVRSETSFGNAGCATALFVQSSAGTFAIDSICGLEYKTVSSSNRSIASVFPNPAHSNIVVTIMSGSNRNASVEIVDMLGRVVASNHNVRCLQGLTTVPFDVSDQMPGHYCVRVVYDRSFTMHPFVLSR